MDICSYFLFCVVINNFSRLLALKYGGKKGLTKDLGVGVQKTCFSSRSCILIKIPQWKKNPTFNILKPKSFDLVPDIQTKWCYVMETVFHPTHSLIFFYGLSSQQLQKQCLKASELQLQSDTISSQWTISYFWQMLYDTIKVQKFLLPRYTFKTFYKWKVISLRACVW